VLLDQLAERAMVVPYRAGRQPVAAPAARLVALGESVLALPGADVREERPAFWTIQASADSQSSSRPGRFPL
jgi:hypothetical protein